MVAQNLSTSKSMSQISPLWQLHREMFGDYVGKLMPKPDDATWADMEGTFGEFLDRHDMSEIKNLFDIGSGSTGYGYLSNCIVGTV